MATAATDTPLVLGPVYGLRTWRVERAAAGERLVAPLRGTVWPDHGRMLVGTCPEAHHAPAPACTCGVHGWHPTPRAARRVCSVRREVPGIIEASGAVEVHEDGFRAERARPHALIVLPDRNARQIERLAEAYDARVLRVDSADELFAYCQEHARGLAQSTVTALIGRERLAREHRRRRRRVVTRVLMVALALLALGGVGALIDPGPEHGKLLYGRSGQVRVP